ncbi:AprI/Inh family metalloprotease inhibitor [Xanthobacter sediminis]
MPGRFTGAIARCAIAALGLLCCVPLPGPARAQAGGQAGAPVAAAPRLDAASLQMAEKIARPFRLASADGERRCDLTLALQPAGAGLAVTRDVEGCAAVAFTAQVSAWVPDPSGSIRLLNDQGRTVAEFTEATGGSYEALREGDGVYFLGPPSAAEGAPATAEEVMGEWLLAREPGGVPLCRWTLTEAGAAQGGYRVEVAPGCDDSLARFGPARWELSGGNILVRGTADGGTIRFARQEDGTWARIPERNRPLLMTRP